MLCRRRSTGTGLQRFQRRRNKKAKPVTSLTLYLYLHPHAVASLHEDLHVDLYGSLRDTA